MRTVRVDVPKENILRDDGETLLIETNLSPAEFAEMAIKYRDSLYNHRIGNRDLILDFIEANPGCTKKEIAEGLHIGHRSVEKHTYRLFIEGTIERGLEKCETGAGRPHQTFYKKEARA